MAALLLSALLASSVLAAPLSNPLTTRDSSSSLTCVNNTSNGTLHTTEQGYWEILCGVEYAGGDTIALTTNTFEDCIAACAGELGCVDVSYEGTSCYLKDELTTLVTNANVWTAMYLTYADIFTCTANGTYFTAANEGTYLIKCGVDHAGGDLSSTNTVSFADCIDLCDQTDGCVDVSYVSPACYLKSTLEPAVEIPSVWTAQKVNGSEPSVSVSVLSKTSNPFSILSAYYADRDVTVAAQAVFLAGKEMIVDTSSLATAMGGDPWSGVQKTIVVLYEYAGEQRVFFALENTGVYTTVAGEVTAANAPGSSALFSYDEVISVVWGPEQLTLSSAVQAVDSQYTTGWGFQVEDLFYGIDTAFGLPKTAVFFYKGTDGSLKTLGAKEHSWVIL